MVAVRDIDRRVLRIQAAEEDVELGLISADFLLWMWYTLKVWMTVLSVRRGPKGSGRTGHPITTPRNEMDVSN